MRYVWSEERRASPWRKHDSLVLSLVCLLSLLFTVSFNPPPASADDAHAVMARVLASHRGRGMRGRARLLRFANGQRSITRLEVKVRRGKAATIMLYRELPRPHLPARAVLLDLAPSRPPRGYLLQGPDRVTAIDGKVLEKPLFDSDLTIADLASSFLSWPDQRTKGEAELLRRHCLVIESRPPKGWPGSTSKVVSWISLQLALPLKVERFDINGHLLRRLTVDRVMRPQGREEWFVRQFTVTPKDGATRTVFQGLRADLGAVVPAEELTLPAVRRELRQSQ